MCFIVDDLNSFLPYVIGVNEILNETEMNHEICIVFLYSVTELSTLVTITLHYHQLSRGLFSCFCLLIISSDSK